MKRGVLVALCVVGLLIGSAPAASARSYAPPRGKAFHGGTGGYTERAMRDFGRRSGRRPAVYQYFFTPNWHRPGRRSMHWQKHLVLKTAKQGARAILHLSTARGGHGASVITPRGIARGQGDTYLKALNSMIARTRHVVYVRLMAEMNNFNNPYCAVTASGALRGSHHSARAFRKAWRRVTVILRGGRVRSVNRKLRRLGMPRLRTRLRRLPHARVSLMWNPFTAGLPNVASNSPGRYWPGGRYVDWVGTDLFANSPNFRGLNRFYRDRRWRRKPFMIGEWAVWGREDPGFVRRLYGWAASHRRAKMLVYNQGAHHPRLLALRYYPRTSRELRRRARSRRYAYYPPELRKRRPRRPPAREPAPPPNETPSPTAPGPAGGEPLPANPLQQSVDPLLKLLFTRR